MYKTLWLMIIALIAMPLAGQAEVYKWKDKDGITRYSDLPPGEGVKYEPLKAKKPANGAVAPTAQKAQDTNKPTELKKDDNTLKPTDANGKTAEQKDAQRKIKEKACANAKENLQKLKAGGILYKTNSKGEREYLDETTVKNETTAAEKEVEISCKE